MPHHKAAYKSLRKDKKRTLNNKVILSDLKTFIKKFDALALSKSADAEKMLRVVIAKISKAASKGIIHKNRARRKLSRLTKKLVKAS